ncbi:MAG TPA: hypothetical protein VF587_20490 [Solirubrobacteraceae bacterium]|jgi:hypothetical protein
MTSARSTTLEEEIRELLQETREEAKQYRSAEYREPHHGKSGLNMRLEAIEESLVRIAAAVDRR